MSEPTAAAATVDLIVDHPSRERGCLAFLLCDAEGSAQHTPVIIDEVPPDADPSCLGDALSHLLTIAADHRGGIVFARGRAGSALLRDTDRAWHQSVSDACRSLDVRLIGAFLATPSGVRTFPVDLRLVS